LVPVPFNVTVTPDKGAPVFESETFPLTTFCAEVTNDNRTKNNEANKNWVIVLLMIFFLFVIKKRVCNNDTK
jgi:hypothetical protein